MELDDNDITGIVALLVRLIRVQDERDAARELSTSAQKRFDEAQDQWRKIRGAFVAFGFDVNSKNLWEEMKAQVGADKFQLAFDRARPNARTDRRTEPQSATEESQAESAEEAEPPANENSEEFETNNASDGISVRDLVLKELKAHPAEGRKASEIRASIEIILGRELHAKTVGMTLYRLSRDTLARREGRAWFAVPETANPGGDAPGSIRSGN